MNEFKTYHPIVNFTYFILVITFSCFFMNPICLGISFFSGFTYSVVLKGKKSIKTKLIYFIPMLAVMAVINPLFNHEGMNILWQLPSGNPITVESVIYGLCAAIMILSVILHFSCYNEVMTSDKFIYLFGKTMPSLSLIISMTFRFVPRFASQLKVVSDAQKCLGRDMRSGGVIMRARSGLNILSIMMTWSLENAIETADSMKSRGYGNSRRTTFSMYKFDKRDKKALIIVVLLGIYIFIGSLMGKMSFTYFPVIRFAKVSLSSISVFVAYLLLCIYPVIIEIREVIRWKALKLKI